MSNPYITLAEFKTLRRVALNDTTDDAMYADRIERASRAIDDATGRRGTGFWLAPAATARRFHAYRGCVTVDSIGSTDGLTAEMSGYPAAIGETYPLNAIAKGDPIERLEVGSALSGVITVTARWGWPDVPPPIKEATFLLANRRLLRRDSPEGVAGQSTDGPIRIIASDTDVVSLITPYVLDGFA